VYINTLGFKKQEVIFMSTILINREEMEQGQDITEFLKTLSPQMQERIKTIVWWESMKPKEQGEAKTAV
jgi:hypothetical protein